jgi:outer membrane receptor protein involved in Fe transport
VNAYTYANVKPVKNVVLTAGASFDHVKGDVPEGGGDQFNPKFGLTWNPHPTTTIRGAAFRTLKRTLVTDQTLEPTQVAGFNQFYDDSDMTQSWRYGGAIDQRFGRKAFAGYEYSRRDMDVPLFNLENVAEKFQWNESLSRAYLFAAPHPMLAVKAQYLAERFERELGFGLGLHDLKTQRVPLGVGFFHPSGGSATVTVTYWDQSGSLEAMQGPGMTEAVPVQSKFWLVDATLRYRLPKRFGFLSVGATNLFDKEFEYFEVDLRNVRIQPRRTIFAKVTLAVP